MFIMDKIIRVRLPDEQAATPIRRKTRKEAIEAHLEIEAFRDASNSQANILRSNLKISYSEEARIRDEVLEKLDGIPDFEERYDFLVDSEYTPYLNSINLSSVRYPAPVADYELQRQAYRNLCVAIEPDKMLGRDDDMSDIAYATPDTFVSTKGKQMAVIERSRRLMSKDYGDFEVKIRKRMSILALDLAKIDSYSRSSLEVVAHGIDAVLDRTGVNLMMGRIGLAEIREFFAEADRRVYAEVTASDMEELFDKAREQDSQLVTVVSNVLYGYIEPKRDEK